MRAANDWRLTNQQRYLKGATLVWHAYAPARPKNDHDHCEFCWAKFMQTAQPETLQEGYSTPDRERWICKGCFDDFVDLFGWKVTSAA
jgi:hypothetical protein